jgi:hypothetical protein
MWFPYVCLYEVSPHCVHSRPSCVSNPALQTHSDMPGLLYMCSGHSIQLPKPVEGLYVPAIHRLQIPGPGACFSHPGEHAVHANPFQKTHPYPDLHEQSITLILLSSELVPAGHAVQVDTLAQVSTVHETHTAIEVDATLVETEPGGHAVHTSSPAVSLYVP